MPIPIKLIHYYIYIQKSFIYSLKMITCFLKSVKFSFNMKFCSNFGIDFGTILPRPGLNSESLFSNHGIPIHHIHNTIANNSEFHLIK